MRFGRDLVDAEIVHYSIVGYFDKGKRHPVHCYTSDDYSQVKSRVLLYLILIDVASRDSIKENKSPLNEYICPANITFYNNGRISGRIDIKKLAKKYKLVF